jgi:two-component system, NarL family, nitrate/nitrite response regulator NarL
MMKIELLLHSRLVRDSLSSVLAKAGLSVLHEPDQSNEPKIVIIDFGDCIDPAVTLAHQQRGAKVVVLGNKAECLKLGPNGIASLSGVLTYELSVDAFIQSLRLIDAGERVVPHDLTRERTGQAPSPSDAPRPAPAHLSRRERETLFELVEGHSNKVIARNLGMTEATVKVHLKSILRKIRVENRTQAAIWALANLPELNAPPRGFV